MKKSQLFSMISILLFFIIFNGCSDESISSLNTISEERVNSTTQSTFKLTLDDIKKKYSENEIKKIQNITTDYILVESQKESLANKFDLYDLKTGEISYLPTMPEYVTLEKVENENYFVFLSSGRNSESPFSTFPYLIKCFRIKNDVDKADNFTAVHEDKYFSLGESVQAGSKEGSLMSDLNITFDGLEVLFKPVKGKEVEFYADAADIPPTKTTYDSNKKQITFEIGTIQLGEGLQNFKKINTNNNQYISSYKIAQDGNKTLLAVNLRDSAKRYLIKIKRLPNGTASGSFPYFSVEFAGEE